MSHFELAGSKASAMGRSAAASNHFAQDALYNTIVENNSTGEWVVAEIHDEHNGRYLVEWSGWPSKALWDWKSAEGLKEENGEWICSEVRMRCLHVYLGSNTLVTALRPWRVTFSAKDSARKLAPS